MNLYEVEIQEKLYILPDDIKKEILHYIDYLSQKYNKDKEQYLKPIQQNPFLELSGFVEIGSMSPSEIDKAVYGL
ncbi:MAG: hypothetical protein A2Y41_10090 [Spirochaetes bacterium GWB1_36_13]|nr:MAG: hypothetical protein A2Y41_10090 [Spirochaetes bacterium GWB1_36_13]